MSEENKKLTYEPGVVQWFDGDYTLPLITIKELKLNNVAFFVKGGSVIIDLDTGDIKVSEGLTLTDAAKGFLNTCAQLLGKPSLFPDVVT